MLDTKQIFPFITVVLEERYAQVLAARAKRLDDLQRKGKDTVPPKAEQTFQCSSWAAT
ncbi:MAG: hypothetical protein KGJ59_14805 [Bacteroidota bacterium]|nr:hypothetical protein [Bacteroidota bacterium]